MGLGSFFKNVGKGLLKAAPFAVGAIPGVGPIAGALMGAGLGAADAKVSGGGLKDVLFGGVSGAGSAGKGLSPSGGMLNSFVSTDKTPSWQKWLGLGTSVLGNTRIGEKKGEAVPRSKRQRQPIGPSQSYPRMDQTRPNLAFPLEYGRQEALGQKPNLPPYMTY